MSSRACNTTGAVSNERDVWPDCTRIFLRSPTVGRNWCGAQRYTTARHSWWNETQDGVISPPDKPNLHSRAFYTADDYTDLTAEFEFNVSYDNGLNWDKGAIIDYPVWAMGCMVAVEPEVVLCTYMNAERDMPLLAQLIKVTPDGIWPLPHVE